MRDFRPSNPADGAAIAALLASAGLHPVARPDVERWKYWQPYGDWPGARSYVLTDDGEVIAHGAVIPAVAAQGSRRTTIIQVVDWAARADAAGAGVALMKRLVRLADAALAVGGSSQTRQILPYLGFAPVAQVTVYVRPLRPRIFGSGGFRAPWRSLPRFVRSLLWTLSAPRGQGAAFGVRRVTADTVADLRPTLPAPYPGLTILERSEAALRHALACPLVPMELYAVERSGRVQGYFLIAIAGRQARLVDCWSASRDAADWRGLIQCAVRQAREHAEVAELAAWASDALLAECLARCGFHARDKQPVSLKMPSGSAPPGTLRVQMLDTDAPYLDPRGDFLWT
jgi:hypothetical protein